MNINAARAIPPDQLSTALSEVLMKWGDDQEKEFVKVIDEAAEACNREIKQYLRKGHGVRTGDYRNHFAVGGGWEKRHHYYREWYVGGGRHRLTHLLEYGHLTCDGTRRTKAVEHIKYGQQIAEQVLEERLAGLWG